MFTIEENAAIDYAVKLIRNKANTNPLFTSADFAKKYLTVKLAHLEHEVFTVLYMDNANRLIEDVDMFRGTVNESAVYPREVVKRALALNANAVIISHNHPSGDPRPSSADKRITEGIKGALDLMDIRLLDHIVVGKVGTYSFSENGEI